MDDCGLAYKNLLCLVMRKDVLPATSPDIKLDEAREGFLRFHFLA